MVENEVPATSQEKSEASETLDSYSGAFVGTLRRNNKKIRDDRAVAIVESAEMIFKRKVEDIRHMIKQKRRDRENMLDLSPTTADSLTLASDFKADEFVDKDIAIGIDLRNLEIKEEIASSRYEQLFGKKI